jgi:hypothetical protein
MNIRDQQKYVDQISKLAQVLQKCGHPMKGTMEDVKAANFVFVLDPDKAKQVVERLEQ